MNSSVCNNKFDDFSVEGPAPPSFTWKEGFELGGEPFDAAKHLQIELPTHVKDQKFHDVEFPYTGAEKDVKCELSYSRPFRVLSDEGIRAARADIDRNKARLGKSTERASCFLRGLGHVSHFHRGLIHSPELLEVLSSLARDPVAPHSMPMNISHTNVGEIATGRPVDRWHTDSTDYVLVIILSDVTDMEGGDLRVLQMPDARATVNSSADPAAMESLFTKMQREGVPEHLVETVRYSGAGYGIFMQGSKILHTVSEVMRAREPRLSLVNSYMSRRVFAQPDHTRYCYYKQADGEEIASVDYARHKAWRVTGQLRLITEHAAYASAPEPESDTTPGSENDSGTPTPPGAKTSGQCDGEGAVLMPPTPPLALPAPASITARIPRPTPAELSEILRHAAQELAHAADLLDGKMDDHSNFVK